jgi:hypothetical protein
VGTKLSRSRREGACVGVVPSVDGRRLGLPGNSIGATIGLGVVGLGDGFLDTDGALLDCGDGFAEGPLNGARNGCREGREGRSVGDDVSSASDGGFVGFLLGVEDG